MKTLKVMIVDDEQDFAAVLAERFLARDIEARAVFCAEDAMALLRAGWKPDVIVLDLKMPGLDGLDALSMFKEFDPALEIIILTGHSSMESGIEGMRRGLFDYLIKPIDIDNLVERIQAATVKKEPDRQGSR